MNLEPIYSPLLSGLVMVPGPSEKVPVTSSCGTNLRVSLPEQWNLLSLPPEAPVWLFVTWTHSPMLLFLSVIWVQSGKFSEALLLFIYFLFFSLKGKVSKLEFSSASNWILSRFLFGFQIFSPKQIQILIEPGPGLVAFKIPSRAQIVPYLKLLHPSAALVLNVCIPSKHSW